MATAEWTVLEKLLLSQAVYKYGEDNWFQIARNLKHHSLLDRPSDYFNQKNCSLQYYLMIEDMDKEKRQQQQQQQQQQQSTTGQDMPVVVRLARQLYALRMEELKQAIQQDEDKFLLLVSEIDDIRSGKWDTKLMKLIVDNNNGNNATLMQQEEKEIVDKENRENEERMKERKRRDQEQDQEDQRPAKRPREEDSAASTPITTTPAISTAATPTAGDEVDHIDTSKTDYSTDFDTSQTATPADTTDLREGTESIAGSDAPTPNSTTDRKRKEDPKFKSWQKNINLLWREIANHKNGAMFMNPIKESIAPHYYDIVKRPMDMKTIKNRIRDGLITTTAEFERDVVLMLTNSLMYNKEGTEVHLLAREMLDDASQQLQIFKTADNDTAASSHTRAASMAAKEQRKSIAE